MADEMRSLDALPENYRELYVKFMIPLLKTDYNISPQKLAELEKLMIRIDLPEEHQKKIIENIFDPSLKNDAIIKDSLHKLNFISFENKEEREAFKFSIIKDMLNIALSDGYLSSEEHAIIDKLAYSLFGNEKKDEAIETAKKAIETEKAFLKGEIGISEYEKRMKDIASLMGGIGIPIAAVYFSGSVVGLSAAGITSGLAALGLGGILGLSSMVTGVGVVILIGVSAYLIIRKILGINEREAERKREELIQEVIKTNQKAIEKLFHLYKELTDRLSILIEKAETSKEEIEILRRKVEAYKRAFEYLEQTNKQLGGLNEQ